jgi:imidazoleglycerol-phosphate dehydratase
MTMRKASLERKTKETSVNLDLEIDGSRRVNVATGIGFFDHMLSLLAYHAGFDLDLAAKGDLEVDQHHTVEDVGLCLGKAMVDALAGKEGIVRFGSSLLPMDEALCMVAIDLSGRPFLSYDVELPVQLVSDFDPVCVKEFLQAFANQAGVTLHIRGMGGENPHHVLEAVFKGVGRALREAVAIDPGSREIPSSKGTL